MLYQNNSQLPWRAEHGEFTSVLLDARGELVASICPIESKPMREDNADLIAERVSGPRLQPYLFYRECYSGRIQTGAKWNQEFEEMCQREFCQIDPADELIK